MGAPRLTSDELGRETAEMRVKCIKAVLAWPERTPQRAASVRLMMSQCSLTKQSAYREIAKYEKALAAGQDVIAAMQRKSRKDAGKPRAGGDTLKRDAAYLEQYGFEHEAEKQRQNAERVAREIKSLWIRHCIQDEHAQLTVAMCERLFREQHPEMDLPHIATLRRWLAEADPALTMTRREALRDKAPRGRVLAREPNHLWLADQHVCDVHIWYTDPVTGETSPRRPTLFSYVDRFTGIPMGGFYSWAYSSETVAMALWEAMLPDRDRGLPFSGLPEHLYWDRGEQHWSEWLRQTCAALRIETHKGAPYEWAPHGFIEGYHNILCSQFEALLPGYVGGDNKEENLPVAWRKFRAGEGPCPELLTLDELNERWYAWRAWIVEQPYQDKKQSRADLYHRNISAERAAYPSWEAFPLAIMRPETRVVSDEGTITIQHLRYAGYPLNELKGERVQIAMLPGHMGRVWILSNDRTKVRGVCEMDNGEIFGSDPALKGAGRRAKLSRRGVRQIDQVKAGLEALAQRGDVSDADVAQAAGVLTRLQAVAKREFTTVEALAQAAPERAQNVVKLRPKTVGEEKPLREAADEGLLNAVLAGAVADPEDEKPSGAGLFNI